MNILTQTVSFVLTYLIIIAGFFIGRYLSSIAKEEMKEGKYWLKKLAAIILFLIATATGVLANINKLILTVLLLAIIYTLTKKALAKRTNTKKQRPLSKHHLLQLIYLTALPILLISITATNLFLINGALFFLYGFPLGSLFGYEENL